MTSLRLPTRAEILPEPELPRATELLAEGRRLARDWTVGPCPFLAEAAVACEADFKRREAAAGRVMRHAQVGFRDPAKSRRAYAEIHEGCRAAGARVDRYGLCLDWAMGYPRALRDAYPHGTGMLLEGPEDFAALTAMAPVAPHFGDFVLGFPSAVENTQAALAAGATSIGNLGQYFAFRLPHWDDEVETTRATVVALGLIAAQPVEMLVHSNLDDGFAAHFSDLACGLGAVLIERHLVETLIGAKVGHCYGHHFSDPLTRLAFQRALAEANPTPGTMVYGNTLAYRGTEPQNWASLAGYLAVDILAQRLKPSGHAINPVPISENRRIPDIDEVVAAQLFADRLVEATEGFRPLLDPAEADGVAAELLAGGRAFQERVLAGLAEIGIDTGDALELLLALKRLGGKRLEALFGPGSEAPEEPRGRKPRVRATTFVELARAAEGVLAGIGPDARTAIAAGGLTALVATTDVHEHGKLLVEQVFAGLGVAALDGGVATDPDDLAEAALTQGVDLIALSTYNGIALAYVEALRQELAARGLAIPVLVGGRLNQIPEGSNSSLPVEVTAELAEAGATVCTTVEAAVPALLSLCWARGPKAAE
ncbi:B12 binding domain-containing protein [Tistlia consotensis]|uniref:B12 binding domain-containing protein n=1 Tax=Tistlia consotensis USBA 355 TaxID=560819 RepID=A0A1Y6CQZ9_9PROT|nr:cobalamin-dependent protein [Tistlia consotensis]SMF72471.1 B12 binding domain-containing protein [Tistlia consotensis USBA 355]SNS09196.1 B12 binding domain-containing protein [Tistlia consotensis]